MQRRLKILMALLCAALDPVAALAQTNATSTSNGVVKATSTPVTPPPPTAPPPPAATASASGTIVTLANGATIVDAQANTWTLGAAVPAASNPDCAPKSCGNVVVENGNSQNGTAATLLLWLNNVLYQTNAAGKRWTWNGSAWKKVAGDPRN
jgi:hypothetical protein